MTTRAWLTQLDGAKAGKVFPIDNEENKLGRLPGIEVPLEGEGISREHALIRRSSRGRYTLADTGSRNGSYVNGKRLKRPQRLKDGDEVTIGQVTLRFNVGDWGSGSWAQSETVSSNIDALLGRLAQAGPSSPAMLVASSGASAGQVFRLDRPRFVLGRDEGADGQIPDAGISRRHAIISAMAGDTYVLDDMGSSNGTFANQQRVDKPYILRDGDMIQLGTETVLRFVASVTGEAQLERTPEATRPPRSKASTAEIEEKELARELALARKVQMTMVPSPGALFDTPAALFVGSVRSASFAAGDLWTHVEQGSKLLVLVADVTGHGVGPAMITTVAKSCLDTVLLRAGDVTIEQAFDTMNRVILGISKQALVMTAFAVEVDPDRQQLSYCSAGHIPQAMLEQGEGGQLEVTPLFMPNTAPLGQSPKSRYEIQRRDYQVGDRLVLFTDGLLEAENRQGSAFGNRRLHMLLRETGGLEIKELLDVVLAQVEEFSEGAPPADDVTVVALELRGGRRQRRKTSPGFAHPLEE